MSQWARENPEQMAEIAALPASQQNAALRHAVGYDPDRIRDQADEAEREAAWLEGGSERDHLEGRS